MRLEDGVWGGTFWQSSMAVRAQIKVLWDDSGSPAPASLHKRRVKGDSCAIRKVGQTLNS